MPGDDRREILIGERLERCRVDVRSIDDGRRLRFGLVLRRRDVPLVIGLHGRELRVGGLPDGVFLAGEPGVRFTTGRGNFGRARLFRFEHSLERAVSLRRRRPMAESHVPAIESSN